MIARLMGLRTIAPKDLVSSLSTMRVFDVNSLTSWQEAHVPGAVRLDPDGFEHADLPQERDQALVFYCSGPLCQKAPRAAKRARAFGYTNVLVMSAGIRGWVSAGMPTEKASSELSGSATNRTRPKQLRGAGRDRPPRRHAPA